MLSPHHQVDPRPGLGILMRWGPDLFRYTANTPLKRVPVPRMSCTIMTPIFSFFSLFFPFRFCMICAILCHVSDGHVYRYDCLRITFLIAAVARETHDSGGDGGPCLTSTLNRGSQQRSLAYLGSEILTHPSAIFSVFISLPSHPSSKVSRLALSSDRRITHCVQENKMR